MIARLVVWASTIASLILVASFALFAYDQARNGSDQQVNKIGSAAEPTNAKTNIHQADPSPKTEKAREKRHGKIRELIDDGNDILVAPFAGIVDSNEIWIQRGLPSLLAFLLFGVGLRIAAAYLPGGNKR
jgi:hypothetical protein